MARIRWYFHLIIILIGFIIGISLGNPVSDDSDIFYTFVLIAIWISATIAMIGRMRAAREFNSPHNTAFFIVGSFFISFIYGAWGNFTAFLSENVLGINVIGFYIPIWTLIFSYPYLLYFTYLCYACFKKYFIVYIGQKSVDSKKFGSVIVLIAFIFEIVYEITLFFSIEELDLYIEPNVIYLDFIRILCAFIIFTLMLKYARAPVVPTIEVPETPRRVQQTRQRNTRRSTSTQRQRTRPNSSSRQSRKATPTQRVRTRKVTAKKKSFNYNALRPKAGVLSLEDFKCIFCFQLPSVKNDKGRGIVICPSCKHPAHADEFKEWTKNSPLCSRCDSTISSNYRHNPKIIPVELYVRAIKKFSKQM